MARQRKNYWAIDGDNNIFDTLSEAKYHCDIAYTPKERIKYLNNTEIYQIKNNELYSTVTIHTDDEGNLSFSKPNKQQPLRK